MKRLWMEIKSGLTIDYCLSTSLPDYLLPMVDRKFSLVTLDRSLLLPMIKSSVVTHDQRRCHTPRRATLQGALLGIAFHCSDSSGESLSMWLRKVITCHTCCSFRELPNAGIPVRRIPC